MGIMAFCDHISRIPMALDPDRAGAAVARLGLRSGSLADLVGGAAGSSPHLAGLIGHEHHWLASRLDHVPDPELLVRDEVAGLDALKPDALGPALRIARRRVALMVALSDLGGVWPLEAVMKALTLLADLATDLAFRAHLNQAIARGRIPDHEADAAGLFVLAMGKMGANELNYSSDIDLIILFDERAYSPADHAVARAALIRVTRAAAATLSDVTDLGHVFRTDLRLRPDPSAMPVCISAAAALAYYEAEGRTWERAAHIKARPCAGNLAAGAHFLKDLRPFVWRRHLDYAAIEDAHSMRLRIRDHKGLHGSIAAAGHDIKLGRGGIREIEFFTQTLQLISGGRDPSLRKAGTPDALGALAAAGWIAARTADELVDHYRHHRMIEHRIQMVDDRQTHLLPADGPGLDAIARLAGAAETTPWMAGISRRLARVEVLTDPFFTPAPAGSRPVLPPDQEALIDGWRTYPALRSARARRIFRRIEADLLIGMQRAANPAEALARFDGFLRGLPAGAQLFALFEANPQLIELIVDICATAPRLADYLAGHSAVLDAVIAGSFFSPWPGMAGLQAKLDRALEAAIAQGYENALDAARRFAHEWQFRIGVHHLRHLIGGAELAGQHADLADAVLAALTPVVVAEFSRRHGPPPGRGAVVLGMGSLAMRQVNAASDLDLIVIFDAAGAQASTGPRPLSPRPYYARLTQALITALSVPTAAGRLYEVDMRLRPSGRQGPVANAFNAFRDYQLHEAWVWEHLALTSARVMTVLGPDGAGLGADVAALRRAVIAERGNDPAILPELAEMRARLFATPSRDGIWEARAGRGGLQDIELLAQSLALRSGSAAVATADQIRAGIRAGLIHPDEAAILLSAHDFLWRFQAARQLLTGIPLDMDHIGEGGRAFLMHQAGAEDLTSLARHLQETVAGAGEVIDRLVSAPG